MKYKVIRNSSGNRQAWTVDREFSKYGKPYVFDSKESAEMFVKRRTYKGMSHNYEIEIVGY